MNFFILNYVFESLIFTKHTEGKKAEESHSNPREIVAKSKRRQKVVESHDRLYSEKKQLIDKEI